MVPGKFRYILGVWLVLVMGCCGPDLVSDDQIRGQDIRPYVGLIRNFSAVDISIPSQDSGATLIVPSQGQMEYTVWKPDVDLFGYAGGKQVYFQNIRINPKKKYTFFGKSYYFLAEVCPDLSTPMMIPQRCPPPLPQIPEPPLCPQPRSRKGVCPG